MFVYVSPRQLDPNPLDVLGETGVRSRTKDLYLGLVAKDSSTAENVSICESRSSHPQSSGALLHL